MVNNRVYICYLLFLTACAEKEAGIVFPETIPLSVSCVHITDVYMRYPYRVRLADSSMYIMDLHATEHYIHRLSDGKTVRHLASYGKRGEAPTELLDAENIRIDSENRLWTLDANKHRLTVWDSDEQSQINLSPHLLRTLDFAFMDDTTLIVPDYTGEYRICLLNKDGEIIRQLFSIPDSRQTNASRPALAQAWRSFIDYNRTTGILAVVTQLGQTLELYDLKTERPVAQLNIKNGAPHFSEKEGYAVPDGIMGYSDVYVSDHAVYALFWGSSFKDMRNGKIKHEGGNRIQVYRTDGTPLKEYQLDRYITGFCIDEANNRLIALDTNSDQPIIEYEFKTTHDH